MTRINSPSPAQIAHCETGLLPLKGAAKMTLPNDIKITPDLVKQHGLKPDEYERFVKLLAASRR